MSRSLTALAAALATGLALSMTGASATATTPPPGASDPVEDAYYPDKGDPTVDALHYRLDLTWRRQSRELRGEATIYLRTMRVDDSLTFDLSHRLEVDSVVVDGRPTGFTHRGNHLVVAEPVEGSEAHRVRIAYRGTPGPARGPATRSDLARVGMRVTEDGRLWTMQQPFGAFTWYPVNDHPSDKALYDVRVSAPGSWVGVSNGELTGRRTTGGRTVTRWTNRYPTPSYLVTLAVGPYRAHHQTGPHDLPMTYWVPRGRPELLKPLLRTPAALHWLERRLGPYPFDRFGIVLTPAGSAMETQTMVTLGERNYGLGRFHVRSVVVHELAHHWWGDLVTPTQWQDLWMSEGMATYLHSRWEDAHADSPETSWRWTVGQWTDADEWLRAVYGPPGAYERDRFASENVYWSTALMWEHLRRKLGDETFDRLVRTWPWADRYSNATRDQLIAWWEARSGQTLKPFFDRWLDSPHPVV